MALVFKDEDVPSPVVPIIVLLIVGTMMTIPSMMAYDPTYWDTTIAEVQSHFVVGALLIPVCLLLAVQAFGIPQVNPAAPRRRPSPFMEAITQDLVTSILLVTVIITLLMLIPFRGSIFGQPPPSYGRW